MSTQLLNNFHEELLYQFFIDYGVYVVFTAKQEIQYDFESSTTTSTDVETTIKVIDLPPRIAAEYFKRPLTINEKYEKLIIVRSTSFTPLLNMCVTVGDVEYKVKEVLQQSQYVFDLICTAFNEGT